MRQSDRSIRVLHVDDEPDVAELTRDMLVREDERFDVSTTTTATDALDRLAADSVDCIISDYDMPGMNGIEFLHSVREEQADLPFILFTGKGSEEVASDAISAGVTDYLQKQPGLEQYELLANRVKNAVSKYRAEQTVSETRLRFQRLVEETTDVTLIVAPDGTISYATESAERILGRSPDELEGSDGYASIHPDDRDHVQDQLGQLVDHPEQRRTAEFRYETPDGSYIWVEARGRNLLDDPVIGGLVVYVRDTTERKEHELDLERIERRYRAIFNDPNILVGLLDTDGTVLDINDTAFEYVERRPETIVGQPFWETPWFDHSAAVRDDVRDWIERARDGDYVDFEVDLRRPNGDPYTIQGVLRPVRDDDGEVVSLIVSDREITEQKQRERELERIRDFFHQAERLGDLGAWEVDAAGDVVWTEGTKRIHEVGESFEPSLETGIEFYHPDDRPSVERDIRAAMQGAASFDIEARLVTAEGTVRWVRSRGGPVGDDGETIRGFIQDITEQKEREHEREQIISRVTDAIVEVDADWTFTLVNEQAAAFYDMTEADLLGANFWDVFDDARGTRFEEVYRRVMETREPESFVEFFAGLDGWFDVHVYPNEDGGLAFYFQEITDRIEREQDLHVMEQIVQEMNDGTLIIQDGVIVFANPRVGDVLGYDVDELVGTSMTEIIAPEHRDAVQQRHLARVDADDGGEPPEMYEIMAESSDGRRIPIEISATQITYRDQPASLALTRNITERKQQERELARQRAMLEAQQESVLDGMLVVDEHGEMVSYNDRFVEMWNVPEAVVEEGDEAAALQYATDQLVDPAEFHEKIEYLYEHTEETARDEIELTDGRVFDRYTTPLTADDGTYFGRLWTFRDITERIEREAELQRQNDRLEEFASIVSHDLRNPLNVAQGRLEMVRTEHESDHHDAIARAHDRIAALIDDLLTLAREGKTVAALDDVSIPALVDRCWQNVDTGASTIQIEYDGSIRADESRLLQLFENLFRNAVEHGGDGVTVTVGAMDGGFFVEDDGVGIPPDARDEVFESGYSTEEDGTGFGLSIVNQVVDAHGWEIRVTEAERGGARFEITNVEPAAS